MKRLAFASASILALALSSPAVAQTASAEETAPPSDAQGAPPAEAVQAAPVDAGQLEEIVVTAQRRRENVQDVPIAVSAFTSSDLAARGVSNALEVTQYVPNFVGLNNVGIGSANTYYIRGLGNTESIATFDPAIGTYVDDIYLSRQNANNLSLFDVERIEVLRGPQGTLFGRNTTGGAVNLIMREPGSTLGGYAELGYGSYNMKLARASIDVPLSGSLAVKLSGFWQDDRGYAKNSTTGERTNDSDGWGLRLGVRAQLGPDIGWTGSLTHIVADGENLLNFDCDPRDPTECDGRFVTTGILEDGGQLAGLITGDKQHYGLGNSTKSDILSSNFAFGFGDVRINAITGYVATGQDYLLDFADGRGFPSISNPFPEVMGFTRGGFAIANEFDAKQFTQEVKATGKVADGLVDFVTGVFYIKEKNRTDFADIFSFAFPPFFPAPDGFALILADRVLRNSAEAIAGYGQVDVNVTDQLTLTGGLRYTKETKKFAVSDNRPVVGSVGGMPTCFGPGQFGPSPCITSENMIANGIPIPRKQTAKLWTPRVAINYEPNRNLLFFASATRGFKSGGWNARGTAPDQLLPFGPEKVWSYELGLKSELMNRRVRLNATAFRLDVTDLQIPVGLTTPTGIQFLTRNFADYRNHGLELELTAIPVPGLNVYASAGFQKDKYILQSDSPAFDEFGVQSVAAQLAQCRSQLAAGLIPGGDATACGIGIVGTDGELAGPVRTPAVTLAVGSNYRFDLGSGGLSLMPAINASYRSKSQTDTGGLTIRSGPIESSSGTVYQANPYSGEYITGSLSPARWIVNSSLTLAGAQDRWSLALECKNCLDEEANESVLANYVYLNPPRTWLLKGRIEF